MEPREDTVNQLKKAAGGCLENVPLKNYTSFGTGGSARYLIFPSSLEEMKNVFLFCRHSEIPILVIGKGTNILVGDGGFNGVVVMTKKLGKIFVKDNLLLCESGVKISSIVRTAIQHSLGGAEFLAGIPGTVGGAVITNAGSGDLWISSIVSEIYVFSPETFEAKNINAEQAGFSYRKSGLESFFVYRTILKLNVGNRDDIKRKVGDYMEKRLRTQPVKDYSAGSVFKNPPGDFAGRLIENAGLKGHVSGGAQISEKHANFIVNKGGASSKDIRDIIEIVQKKVKKLYNVDLETEIKFAGQF